MDKFRGNPFFKILLFTSLSSVWLFLFGVIFYDSGFLWFLNWNLFLAWLPLISAWMLCHHLKKNRWLSVQGIVWSVVWLVFLPNSFYIASDFVHLKVTATRALLFTIVMLMSFTINGMILGFSSLYLVHRELVKRLKPTTAHGVVTGVLLLSSFAIYLGRYLRWNTWDLLINPAGLIFDISDRLINPSSYAETFRITFVFFVLLSSLYATIWQATRTLRDQDKA